MGECNASSTEEICSALLNRSPGQGACAFHLICSMIPAVSDILFFILQPTTTISTISPFPTPPAAAASPTPPFYTFPEFLSLVAQLAPAIPGFPIFTCLSSELIPTISIILTFLLFPHSSLQLTPPSLSCPFQSTHNAGVST